MSSGTLLETEYTVITTKSIKCYEEGLTEFGQM